jgi:predicted N-acetyltransferase YhbS
MFRKSVFRNKKHRKVPLLFPFFQYSLSSNIILMETPTIEIRPLCEDQVGEYYRLLVNVFPHRSVEYFEAHLRADPDVDFSSIFAAFDASVMIATARIHWRRVTFAGRIETVAGIGEVATLSQYRGQGIATRLLRRCIQTMDERGVRISALHTRSAAPVYAKLGWEAIVLPWVEIDCPSVAAAAPSVERADIADLHTRRMLAALHNAAPVLPGVLWRSNAFWDTWLPAACAVAGCHVFVARRDDIIVAYVALRVAESAVRMADCGWRADAASARLFQQLCVHGAACIAPPASSVRLLAPRGVVEAAAAMAGDAGVLVSARAAPSDDGMMWRGDEALMAQLRALPSAVFFDADMF